MTIRLRDVPAPLDPDRGSDRVSGEDVGEQLPGPYVGLEAEVATQAGSGSTDLAWLIPAAATALLPTALLAVRRRARR